MDTSTPTNTSRPVSTEPVRRVDPFRANPNKGKIRPLLKRYWLERSGTEPRYTYKQIVEKIKGKGYPVR